VYGVVDREKIRSPGWSKIRSPVSEKKFVLRVGELATAILRRCCRSPGLLHCVFVTRVFVLRNWAFIYV